MKFVFTLILLLVIFSFTITSVDARTISPFKFKIDEYYLHASNAHLVVQPGTETKMPIKVKNTSEQPYNFKFHTTLGDQVNPPPFPKYMDAKFVPNEIFLEPDEEIVLDLVIDVSKDTKPKLYNLGIVGIWKDEGKIPNFMGSSVKVHIGKYFGDKVLADNFDIGKPLDFFRDGVTSKDIPCYNDYVVVVKKSNGFPACVKFDSVVDLVNRGWAQKDLSFQYIQVEGIKPAYYYDEDISFSVKRISYGMCDSLRFEIYDENENRVWNDTVERLCISLEHNPDKANLISFELPQKYSTPIILDDVGDYLLIVKSADNTAEIDFEITTEGFDIFTINSVAGCSNMRLEKLSKSEWDSRQDERYPPLVLRNQDFKDNPAELSLLMQMLDAMNPFGMWGFVDEKTIKRDEIQTSETRQSNIWNWFEDKWDEQHSQTPNKTFTSLFTHGNDFYEIIWGPIC